MKPIIIISGFPHSYTSVLTHFLHDNGFHIPNIWHNPLKEYQTWENKAMNEFFNKRNRIPQQKVDLTQYLNSLPVDRVCILKLPRLGWFLSELKDFTDREIRVVMPIRRPNDVIRSTMEKSLGRTFQTCYYDYNRLYDTMINCPYPVHPIIMERFMAKDEGVILALINFIKEDKSDYLTMQEVFKPQHIPELYERYGDGYLEMFKSYKGMAKVELANPDVRTFNMGDYIIDTSMIKPIKVRKTDYIRYRILKLFIKRI